LIARAAVLALRVVWTPHAGCPYEDRLQPLLGQKAAAMPRSTTLGNTPHWRLLVHAEQADVT